MTMQRRGYGGATGDPRPGEGAQRRRAQRRRVPGPSMPPPQERPIGFPGARTSQQATRGLDPRNRPAPQQRRMSSPFRSPPAIAPQGPLPQVAPGMPFTPLSPPGQGGAPPFSGESPWDYFRKQYEKLPWWANPFSMLPPPIQEMPLMNPFNMWTDPEGWMPSNTPGLNRYERLQLGR